MHMNTHGNSNREVGAYIFLSSSGLAQQTIDTVVPADIILLLFVFYCMFAHLFIATDLSS